MWPAPWFNVTYSESVHILLDCLRYYNQAESNRLVGDEARKEPWFQKMASIADSHKAPDTIDFNWQRSGNKTLRGTKEGSSFSSRLLSTCRKWSWWLCTSPPFGNHGDVRRDSRNQMRKREGGEKKERNNYKVPQQHSRFTFNHPSNAVTSYRWTSSQKARQSLPAAGSQMTIGQHILCRS